MAVSPPVPDHDYCRMDPIPSQYHSGLGIQKHFGLIRMETVSPSVQENLPKDGSSSYRPFCIQNIQSTGQILQLESGPRLRSSRCVSAGLEPQFPLRISTFLPHYKSSQASDGTISGEDGADSPSVAITTMVSSPSGNVHRGSSTSSKHPELTFQPVKPGSSSTSKFLSKPSGLACIRDRLSGEGISKGASDLILNSRRKGTTHTYESAWKKWSLWCGRRSVDPSICPVDHVLDYLAEMFQNGSPYKTIALHRSAISAYHVPIAVGQAVTTVGRHPHVSSLVSGVHNLRPPQAKYSFTWDIEVVLRLFKSWPLDPSPKQMTYKVTTLLALIGVPRGAELHLFDLNFLADFGHKILFELPGTVKNVKEGKKPAPLEFNKHEQDVKLCPVSCVRKYIALTESWRDPQGLTSAFFLAIKHPINQCQKPHLLDGLKKPFLWLNWIPRYSKPTL